MGKEKLLEIKDKVSQNSIHISRVPKKTKERFQELANEEFTGDYGMTLKWLLDFRDGLLATPNRILMEQLGAMAERIRELESESVPEEPPKKRVIKTVGGKIIEKRE